ncbi:MAG TPA: magnesium/cobalt transporter CorA [Flavobacteriales bacterium]|nr:magnesium/cobalt transporter CorA [Flavobacteriales bacterium]HMW96568.1 magnesium/cobalt transporter CorA [Flavobacteriales bacterium]HMZ49214.1 magnesium/cobalt transporter CorA [Flavobacteriales bacterium]HNE80714.1 magnesium/cobalt transporter CorA [Flavobacteriales bacterium]HNI05095.1 magnesium/cobalt transporter CorA [Flavobacteriales bacterium]
MISIHLRGPNGMERREGLAALALAAAGPERTSVVWIDLIAPDETELKDTEAFIGSELMTPKDAAEIESSSRFYEDANEIQLNAHFLQSAEKSWRPEPVTFVLHGDVLVTRRTGALRSFTELERRRKNSSVTWGAHETFAALFDLRIDLDADIVEQMGREITQLNRDVNLNKAVGKELLLRIDEKLDEAMLLRANIVDKQRTLAAVLKSERFPHAYRSNIRTLLRDIASLLEHIAFGFERLEFLQNTALGLLNIEQNKVIKIFTVATVVFMPPTLVASIYGMNFEHMPELAPTWGYPFALALMLLSSGFTLHIFKRKGWL